MSYSLVHWEEEITNVGITYVSDDYSITGDYVGIHNEIREWVLYSFSGYKLKRFTELEDAMSEVEYLHENVD